MSSARPPPTTVMKNAQKSAMSMYVRNMRDGYRVAAFERKLPCGKGRWRSALLLRPHPVRHGAGNPRAEYQDHDHQTGDNAWCARLERVPSMYIPTVESTVKSAIMVTHQIGEALRSRDMGAPPVSLPSGSAFTCTNANDPQRLFERALVSKQPNENGEETMLGADETGSRLGGQERVGLGDGGACSFLELLPVLLEARPRARHPTQPPCARSKVDVILARDRDAALSQRPNDHIVVQTWRMVGRLGASARDVDRQEPSTARTSAAVQ